MHQRQQQPTTQRVARTTEAHILRFHAHSAHNTHTRTCNASSLACSGLHGCAPRVGEGFERHALWREEHRVHDAGAHPAAQLHLPARLQAIQLGEALTARRVLVRQRRNRPARANHARACTRDCAGLRISSTARGCGARARCGGAARCAQRVRCRSAVAIFNTRTLHPSPSCAACAPPARLQLAAAAAAVPAARARAPRHPAVRCPLSPSAQALPACPCRCTRRG